MMLPHRIASRKALFCLRLKTTSTPAPKSVSNTKKFPERLIIYHAGTGRTVFLGCMKVTTIFICAFFCAVMAPTHFFADEPKWVAATVMVSGLVPVTVVGYISAPFVTYIHLRLPAFARHSYEMLLRYSKSLPKNAELDITTMNFIGKPRVARVKIADIYPVKQRLGFANYARDAKALNTKRPWYAGKVATQFGVHNEKSGVMGGVIWENVAKCIAKNRRN
ncbi:hypothetical protein BUE80_DR001493 [Diplocarpon rosae]|nr:hypothetical protein BUE80_DR001493 [Diplocarpon rosae]